MPYSPGTRSQALGAGFEGGGSCAPGSPSLDVEQTPLAPLSPIPVRAGARQLPLTPTGPGEPASSPIAKAISMASLSGDRDEDYRSASASAKSTPAGTLDNLAPSRGATSSYASLTGGGGDDGTYAAPDLPCPTGFLRKRNSLTSDAVPPQINTKGLDNVSAPPGGIPPGLMGRRRSSSVGASPRPPTPTHRLAETAVGVREVARSIGRARVRCDNPKTVMIVTKIYDAKLVHLTREMTTWLIDSVRAADGDDVTVYVDAEVRTHPSFNYASLAAASPRYANQIHFWTPELCAEEPEIIDFVITLGGDGTVLYTSWLFQHIVPPVIPFHLGSLGFLTVFDFTKYKQLLRHVFAKGVRVNMRMRFSCTVFRARDEQGRTIAASLPRKQSSSIRKLLRMGSAQMTPPRSTTPVSALPSADFRRYDRNAPDSTRGSVLNLASDESFPSAEQQPASSSTESGLSIAGGVPRMAGTTSSPHMRRDPPLLTKATRAAAAAAVASGSSPPSDPATAPPVPPQAVAGLGLAAGSGDAAPLTPLTAAFQPMLDQTRRTSMNLEDIASDLKLTRDGVDAAPRKTPPPRSTVSPAPMSASGSNCAAASASPATPNTPMSATTTAAAAAAAAAAMAPTPHETQFVHNGVRITTETFQVLNELVVDRGPSAYMSQLELFGDERHLTTVQADGLVVSTPTGSTAYSLSAGGSIVHPEVSAVLVTPICPHTLSFRPMLLPDSMELKVCVPPTSRNTAWASFDGRHRIELKQGDFISITASRYPFPTLCMTDQSSDWFNSLGRCLRWNERQRQKAFQPIGDEDDDEDDEDDPAMAHMHVGHLGHGPSSRSSPGVDDALTVSAAAAAATVAAHVALESARADRDGERPRQRPVSDGAVAGSAGATFAAATSVGNLGSPKGPHIASVGSGLRTSHTCLRDDDGDDAQLCDESFSYAGRQRTETGDEFCEPGAANTRASMLCYMECTEAEAERAKLRRQKQEQQQQNEHSPAGHAHVASLSRENGDATASTGGNENAAPVHGQFDIVDEEGTTDITRAWDPNEYIGKS